MKSSFLFLLPAIFPCLAQVCLLGATVTNCDETSLRAALSAGGTVTFACDGVINVSNTITISRNASLDAAGHKVIVSGNDVVRPFDVQSGVEFSLSNLTIAHGFNSISGGGIHSLGTLNVLNCTFTSNSTVSAGAPNGSGGAIHGEGTLRVSGSTFIDNHASFKGGAIVSGPFANPGQPAAGQAFVTNCTFVGNQTSVAGAVATLSSLPGQIVNCTFASNTGGAVFGSFTLINSILANSSGAYCSFTDAGNNISSDNSCPFTNPSSRNNVDPKLGPLANNGGPTLTVSLLDGSPAIDMANAAACPLTDQRGYPRPYAAGCDIGAFETTLVGTNRGAFQFAATNYSSVESDADLLFTVIRVGGTFGQATVNFATVGNSATPGADFVGTNGTLTFAQGEPQRTFSVRLLNDSLLEGDESFSVTLSAPTGGAILTEPHSAIATIIDDETPAVVAACDESSLRAAMASRPVVVFSCDGVIVLTNSIFVSQNVCLDGTGHIVIISGSNAVRQFVIGPAATLSLRHLTLADGFVAGTNGNPGVPGGSADGGAIYNAGGMVLANNCSFVHNAVQGGTGGTSVFPQILGNAGGSGRGGVLFNTGGGRFLGSNCQFTLNRALGGTGGGGSQTVSSGGEAAGGVAYCDSGTICLDQGVVSSNSVVPGQGRRFNSISGTGLASGGAIVSAGGEITATGVLFTANSAATEYLASASGGAIHLAGGTLEATGCRFTGNIARGGRGLGIGSPAGIPGGHGFGGAVGIFGGSGRFRNSTLDHNVAAGGAEPGSIAPAGFGMGGGLYALTEAQLLNCTLASNEARSGPARAILSFQGRARGGAICNDGGNMALNYVTIARNAALQGSGYNIGYFEGGGLYSVNGSLTISNCIVAYSPSGSNCFGSVIDGGHNISSDPSCQFTAPGSLNGTDPVLGPLADYGGPTPSVALLGGSPAIDVADPGSCPSTDQRGIARPYSGACDIGAFESAPPYTILGRIDGYLQSATGITVHADAFTSPVASDGSYGLHGLSAGTVMVIPTAGDAIFVLSNQVVAVNPDVVGVNFRGYQSNAFSIERLSGSALRSIFAGAAGETWRVSTSSNLLEWFPYSTNTVRSSGLFELVPTDSSSSSRRYFKGQQP